MPAKKNRVNIAMEMLMHNKRRLAISASAVAFTVVIMFMEMGFFNGINDSQALLATLFNADLVVMDKKNVHLNKFSNMDRARLMQLLGIDGVEEVVPMYKGNVGLKNPKTGMTKIIFVLAFPPDSKALKVVGLSDGAMQLKKRRTILFDRKSRAIYGQVNPGQDVEIEGHKFRVGGLVEMGPNFSIDGTVLMSDTTWLLERWQYGAHRITYGLLRTRPGSDIAAVKKLVRERMREDILVMTPEEIRRREILHTIKAVPLGAIFGVGMIIGFIIGIIICYQILYNEITDHLPQYATLRAMGFNDRFLRRVVVEEAAWLSIIGFFPGVAFSYLIYSIIELRTGILMFFSPGRILLILFFTVSMCIIGGLIAVKRVTAADPAELY